MGEDGAEEEQPCHSRKEPGLAGAPTGKLKAELAF